MPELPRIKVLVAPGHVATIRPARAADLPAAAGVIADDRGEDERRWRERFTEVLADPHRLFLVAELDDEVVGFGQARLVDESPARGLEAPPAGWYLSGVTVSASARRRGVGEALTRARIDFLSALTNTIHFLAEQDNHATIALHTKLGFKPVGEFAFGAEDRRHLLFTLELDDTS